MGEKEMEFTRRDLGYTPKLSDVLLALNNFIVRYGDMPVDLKFEGGKIKVEIYYSDDIILSWDK